MTNGEKILKMFPDATIKFYRNLSGILTVDVDFNNEDLKSWGDYNVHTFTRKWWDSEVDTNNVILQKKEVVTNE